MTLAARRVIVNVAAQLSHLRKSLFPKPKMWLFSDGNRISQQARPT